MIELTKWFLAFLKRRNTSFCEQMARTRGLACLWPIGKIVTIHVLTIIVWAVLMLILGWILYLLAAYSELDDDPAQNRRHEPWAWTDSSGNLWLTKPYEGATPVN